MAIQPLVSLNAVQPQASGNFIYISDQPSIEIAQDIDVGEHAIYIAAKDTIYMPDGVTIQANKIILEASKHVYHLGKISCRKLSILSPISYGGVMGNFIDSPEGGPFRGMDAVSQAERDSLLIEVAKASKVFEAKKAEKLSGE